jgi:hypothetical protein
LPRQESPQFNLDGQRAASVSAPKKPTILAMSDRVAQNRRRFDVPSVVSTCRRLLSWNPLRQP